MRFFVTSSDLSLNDCFLFLVCAFFLCAELFYENDSKDHHSRHFLINQGIAQPPNVNMRPLSVAPVVPGPEISAPGLWSGTKPVTSPFTVHAVFTVFSLRSCPYCVAAKAHLTEHGIKLPDELPRETWRHGRAVRSRHSP